MSTTGSCCAGSSPATHAAVFPDRRGDAADADAEVEVGVAGGRPETIISSRALCFALVVSGEGAKSTEAARGEVGIDEGFMAEAGNALGEIGPLARSAKRAEAGVCV